jgi:hypothetical protein
MTGPEHYQIAEQLLGNVTQVQHYGPPVILAENGSAVIAAAQVHATLALAAATALPQVGEMPVTDHDAWSEAVRAPEAGGTA